MALNSDYIACVDIGTTKIVCLVGRKEPDGRIRILGFGRADSKGVKRGVVQNIDETANAIQEAVNQARQTSGINFTDVYVGIAGQHIKSQKNRHSKYIQSNDNEIKKEDVEELTSDMYKISLEAGEEIIHVIPQSYIVDNDTGVKRPVGMYGKKLEANFHIVVGQVSSTKNINRCVNRAGLNVIKLILEPLASSDAVLTDDEKEAGVALVDIGGGTTDLAVFYDNVIRHTAVIPFGGNVVTNDIKEGCSILARQAEELKIKYGSALGDLAPENKVVSIPGISGREPKEISFRTLAYIIQARMEEIIDTIAFELENSGYNKKLGAGIALTGGGAMLKHLPQLMKFKTGLDVRLGYPKKYITGEGISDLNQTKYSTAIGLLIKGYEYSQLLNERTLYEETVKEKEIEVTEEAEVSEKNVKQGKKLFNNFSKTLKGFFDDKDDNI
jgi:cell division protein FtsA